MTPIYLILSFSSLTLAAGQSENVTVCQSTELQTKSVNVSYLQPVQIKKYKFCLTGFMLRCPVYENTMETKWRTEKFNRTVLVTSCCPGYKNVTNECVPHCSKPCINGRCSAPETCSCNSGFSGDQCQDAGCPDGRFGEDCAHECDCQNGGHCHHVTGACTCPPGYFGLKCQSTCPKDKFGLGCESDCTCANGFQCQHVTGDCTPCLPDTFGHNCEETCTCDPEGTELCSHKDGKCLCKSNRFGDRCEMYCPFGYVNKTCYHEEVKLPSPRSAWPSPLQSGCECSNHLYECDPVLGCVCPHGVDCGIQDQRHEIWEAASSSKVEDQGLGSGITALISILIIVLVIVVIMAVYYRRRLLVVAKDLQNRRFIFMETNINNARHNAHMQPMQASDVVLSDAPPIHDGSHSAQSDDMNIERQRNVAAGPSSSYQLPPVNISLASQVFIRNPADGMRPEKNTNLNRSCSSNAPDTVRPVSPSNQDFNINLFSGDIEKEKNGKVDIVDLMKQNLVVDMSEPDGAAGYSSSEWDCEADFDAMKKNGK